MSPSRSTRRRRSVGPCDDPRRDSLVALNARLAACRACHERGFLGAPESVPIVADPEPDAPSPRILLIGQAPGLRAAEFGRPFAIQSAAGRKLRAWLDEGGISPEDFERKVHCVSVTRCFPGRAPHAKGDRLPSPAERDLCRPWLEETLRVVQPEVVLLVGLLAIREVLGPTPSLTAAVGTATLRDGVLHLPLPHPSGVSRWLNQPANVHAVGRAMDILRGWVAGLGL